MLDQGEEAPVGAEADPDVVTIPLNAIVALFVEIDRDPDNVGAELGVPNVGDAGSVDSVVGGARGRQRSAEDVDHQTVRLAEDEVPDLHGPADVGSRSPHDPESGPRLRRSPGRLAAEPHGRASLRRALPLRGRMKLTRSWGLCLPFAHRQRFLSLEPDVFHREYHVLLPDLCHLEAADLVSYPQLVALTRILVSQHRDAVTRAAQVEIDAQQDRGRKTRGRPWPSRSERRRDREIRPRK